VLFLFLCEGGESEKEKRFSERAHKVSRASGTTNCKNCTTNERCCNRHFEAVMKTQLQQTLHLLEGITLSDLDNVMDVCITVTECNSC